MYVKTTIHVVFILTFFSDTVYINMSIMTDCVRHTIITVFFMQNRHFSQLSYQKSI